MKFIIRVFIVLLISGGAAMAQNGPVFIKGRVVDSLNQGLSFSSIVLLEARDSTIYQFTSADPMGNFLLKKVHRGEYLLQVSFVGYQLFEKPLSIPGNTTSLDLGMITLASDARYLSEVTVEEERIPIQFKADTLEYDALAFKTRPNAVVEDLLKKLPGVEVDRDGKIMAQGEEVRKVLVNGKEFFGDDPKIATKNLEAEAVDKVQVFDKKSDLAIFTGMDDGNQQRAINLKLKKNRKQGYFGKILGGYGTDNRHRGQMNINSFTDDTQLSAIGMSNNINERGFSTMRALQNRALGAGIQNGLVTTHAGGINFNHEFSKQSDWRSSYFYTNVNQSVNRDVFQNSILEEDIYTLSSQSRETTKNHAHNLDFRYEHEFNATNVLLWNGRGRIVDERNSNLSGINILDETERQQSNNRYGTDFSDLSADSDLLFRHRFRKKGRFMVADLGIHYSENEIISTLESETDILAGMETEPWQTTWLWQLQDRGKDRKEITAGFSYAEPIGKNSHFEISYQRGTKQRAINRLLEESLQIGEATPDESGLLDNTFESNYDYHQPGFSFKMFKNGLSFSTGLSTHLSELSSQEPFLADLNVQKFEYLLPQFNLRYPISRSSQLSLRYDANVIEPPVGFMQPVTYNTNQFTRVIGNPSLRVEYQHDAKINFRSFSAFSFTSFFANMGLTRTNDKIVRSVSIDQQLVRSVQWINADHETTYFLNAGFSTPIRSVGAKINIKGSVSNTHGFAFINGPSDRVNRWNSRVDLSIENRKKEYLDLLVGVRLNNNSSRYNNNSSLDFDFLRQTYYTDISIYFLDTWELYSTMNLMIFPESGVLVEERIPLWTASISKSFLKNNRGQLSLAVFDILGVNKNFSQTSRLNFVETARTNALGRYFMLSLSYRLHGLR